MNSTLDIQWQPRNDLAIDIGYVNGLGRHEIIPIPFNQARIASPTNPLCGPAAVCANPSGSPLLNPTTYGYHGADTGGSFPGCVPLLRIHAFMANLPNGQPQCWRILKAATWTCASPISGTGRSRSLYGRRNLGLQRFAGPRRKEAQPRASGWAFLHVLTLP